MGDIRDYEPSSDPRNVPPAQRVPREGGLCSIFYRLPGDRPALCALPSEPAHDHGLWSTPKPIELPKPLLDLLVALATSSPTSTPWSVLSACADLHRECPEVWEQVSQQIEAARSGRSDA